MQLKIVFSLALYLAGQTLTYGSIQTAVPRSDSALASNTPAEDPTTRSDLEIMQGRWEMVSYKRFGVEAEKQSCLYIFKGRTMTVYPAGRRPSFYTLKIDASGKPKKMDIIATWPDGRTEKSEAIYKLTPDLFCWYLGTEGGRLKDFPPDLTLVNTYICLRKLSEK